MTPAAPRITAEATALIREIAATRSFTQGSPRRFRVTPDGATVLFLRGEERGREQSLYAFDVQSGRTRLLASARSLLQGKAEELSVEERARRERQRLLDRGIAHYALSQDGTLLLIPLGSKLFVVELASGQVRGLEGTEGAMDARFSPDGRYVSFVRDHDLHACEWRAGRVFPVTRGGTEAVSHGEAEFVAQEEMGRHTGYWWSPDSQRLAYQEADSRKVDRRYLADPSAPRRPPQPWAYPRAGSANVSVRLGVTGLDGGETTWIDWDRNRYPYLATVRWEQDAPLTLLVQTRDQREEVLLAVDAGSGRTRELLRETDPAWLNLQPRMPWWLEGGREFLWMSEADGEWRLSLHGADGARRRVLNPGHAFRLRGVLFVDERRKTVVVTGAERAPEQHIFEVPLAGGPPRRLTEAPGVHTRRYGRKSAVHVSKFEDLSRKGPYEVRREDGSLAGVIESKARELPFVPRVELTRVGPSGEFDAALVRPRDFVPGRRYPVLVSVYGGPGASMVRHALSRYLYDQWFADLGFVVVATDNRGTPDRGRAWERAIQGSFGEIPLADQVTALQALGARYPELDLRRVGIWGWSFGGYLAALAVAKRGDVFHAGVAGAPVVEWTEYDTHYTERYLGLPQENAAGYRASSVLTYLDQLRRPLLVIHGTADDNVYFDHSLKLVEGLFRRGAPFEFVPLVGHTHLPVDPEIRARVHLRIAAFLVAHLARQGS
jgi:dipeptidyl-peptidase-4